MKSSIIVLIFIIVLVAASNSCSNEGQYDETASIKDKSHPIESVAPSTHQQSEETMPSHIISAEIEPLPQKANQAAIALQRRGFRILHIGPTISVQAPRELWESTFNVSFELQQRTIMPEINSETTYLRAITDDLHIPEELQSLISGVMFAEPPELY